MSTRKSKKPYWEMSTVELAAATKEFDREFVADEFKPLSGKEKQRWLAAAKKPTRSVHVRERAGKKQTMTFEVDAALAKSIARFMRATGMTLDELVEQSLRLALQERSVTKPRVRKSA